MRQNITISMEKEVIKKGRIIAARKETSISRMLGDLLKEITDNEDSYQAARRSALQNLKKGFHLGGKIKWKRDDLYER